MNGWGSGFLTIAPDGTALPCQAARHLPGLAFPKVRLSDLKWIWNQSPSFAVAVVRPLSARAIQELLTQCAVYLRTTI